MRSVAHTGRNLAAICKDDLSPSELEGALDWIVLPADGEALDDEPVCSTKHAAPRRTAVDATAVKRSRAVRHRPGTATCRPVMLGDKLGVNGSVYTEG